MLDIHLASVTRILGAPREQVWWAMTDLDRMQADLSRVGSFELLTSGPFAEGTCWREERRLGRRSAVLTMTVETAVANEGYVATGQVDGTRYRLTYHLVPHGSDRTTVIGAVEYQAAVRRSVVKRVAATAFGTPAERLLRRELATELERVERAARQYARN